jgi:hypothetical protein
VTGIEAHFADAADAACPTASERTALRGREILNPYLFFDEP